jgi:hypothetical protein
MAMKQTECMYGWTPWSAKVAVGPWPDRTGWSDGYEMTAGACDAALHTMSPDERSRQLLLDFVTITALDSVSAPLVHQAFLAIDEWVGIVKECVLTFHVP